MESISVSIFSIYYLFLCMAFLRVLESKANFIVWSLLTVITIGEIKFWSEQLLSYSMCPSSRSFLISLLSRTCKIMGTLLPFWCLGWKIFLKIRFNNMNFRSANAWDKLGNWFTMSVLNGHWVVIVLTILPSSEKRVWVIEISSISNKSLPISGFIPSRKTTNSASSIRQPVLSIGACIIPMTGIGSLEKAMSSCAGAVVSHSASVELFIASVARNSFKKLHTLPESMRSPTLVFPICKIVFLGSIWTVLLAMLATILSSEMS